MKKEAHRVKLFESVRPNSQTWRGGFHGYLQMTKKAWMYRSRKNWDCSALLSESNRGYEVYASPYYIINDSLAH